MGMQFIQLSSIVCDCDAQQDVIEEKQATIRRIRRWEVTAAKKTFPTAFSVSSYKDLCRKMWICYTI